MTTKKEDGVFEKFAIAVVGMPIIITIMMPLIALSAIYHGVVLRYLWQWFVTEPFGIRPLTLSMAVGINLIVAFMIYRVDTQKDEDKKDGVYTFVTQLYMPLIYFFIGWVYHWFMHR